MNVLLFWAFVMCFVTSLALDFYGLRCHFGTETGRRLDKVSATLKLVGLACIIAKFITT